MCLRHGKGHVKDTNFHRTTSYRIETWIVNEETGRNLVNQPRSWVELGKVLTPSRLSLSPERMSVYMSRFSGKTGDGETNEPIF